MKLVNLQETKRASSEQLGDYVHLNEYKLDRVLGQGSYGLVKLAYNKEENKNYVRIWNFLHKLHMELFPGDENSVQEKITEKGRPFHEAPSQEGRRRE